MIDLSQDQGNYLSPHY